MANGGQATEYVFGHAIIDCLRAILKRCDETGTRLDFPGEGGERSFRAWLVADFIIKLLGWPAEKVVVGERFDILLQDADGFPIATIETKTPYHKANKKDRESFEERLSGYGTLRTAYFTNGTEWERLDIFTPTGVLDIRERFELRVEAVTPEKIEAFFTPIVANRRFGGTPRSSRHVVNRNNPHILEALAADLDQAIGDLALFLNSFFRGLRDGKAGEHVSRVTTALFNFWCEKSLIITPQQAAAQLVQRFKDEDLAARDVAKALAELGLPSASANQAAEELLSLPKPQRHDVEAVTKALWPAYEHTIENLCAQTAHVVLARALLYRVGEDQMVVPRLLSGEQMEQALAASVPVVIETPRPATELLRRVRLDMRSFLPTVYNLGEFDWWLVDPEKRATLNSAEITWLRQIDAGYERAIQRLLRMLNGYFFGRVDVDVWRNIYQHYLPAEERQRLGGFYTPDELVNLILDLSQYTPETKGLCKLSFIDPACGSGAFVTGALGRLLAHLELALPCHTHLHKRGVPDWKRAEQVLNIVADHLHAIDLHPFAAFLTTLNVLFLILPLYVKAREKNQDFSVNLHIFSADALEKHDADIYKPDLFASLNARVQLTEESFYRYQEMLKKRFDRVFGNPPWGGVLKGSLAPVYDTIKKQRFAHEFPAAAQGKYDIYGLFVERALQILKPNGRFGLLTQGSFIDKEWARGLRELLAGKTRLQYIVDLNPFGQLFFNAMNTPCAIVGECGVVGDGECRTVLSAPPADFKGLDKDRRRVHVVATIKKVLTTISGKRKKTSVGFAHAMRISREQLRETAKDRWNLAEPVAAIKLAKGVRTAGDLLEMRQGVTPGGSLEIFLLTEEEATRLEIEKELLHRAIKSKKIHRWRVDWAGQTLFYPYHITADGAVPAFTIDLKQVKDQELLRAIKRLDVNDTLDFDKQLDNEEIAIVRRKGINRDSAGELLRHRLALGLVRFPKAAHYLIQHYEKLANRVFEKKRFTDIGKSWYEYHRPRDPKIMLGKKRLVSPTLVKHVRFALDSVGYLSDHACLYLQPTDKTSSAWMVMRKQLAEVLGRKVADEDVLKYCLAFLNSNYAQERLTAGRRPTPKGFYAVTEKYLHEIPIPLPSTKKTTVAILNLVDKLIAEIDKSEIARQEKALAKTVDDIVKMRS